MTDPTPLDRFLQRIPRSIAGALKNHLHNYGPMTHAHLQGATEHVLSYIRRAAKEEGLEITGAVGDVDVSHKGAWRGRNDWTRALEWAVALVTEQPGWSIVTATDEEFARLCAIVKDVRAKGVRVHGDPAA